VAWWTRLTIRRAVKFDLLCTVYTEHIQACDSQAMAQWQQLHSRVWFIMQLFTCNMQIWLIIIFYELVVLALHSLLIASITATSVVTSTVQLLQSTHRL